MLAHLVFAFVTISSISVRRAVTMRPSGLHGSFLEFLLPDIFDRPVIAVFGGADIFRLAFTSSYLRADT
jgi:hypothetical protein